MPRISRTGSALVGAYLVAVGATWLYALTCSGLFCGFVVLWTAYPWQLLELYLPDTPINYACILVLNCAILYGVGSIIDRFRTSGKRERI
jgi:hypothetical protein